MQVKTLNNQNKRSLQEALVADLLVVKRSLVLVAESVVDHLLIKINKLEEVLVVEQVAVSEVALEQVELVVEQEGDHKTISKHLHSLLIEIEEEMFRKLLHLIIIILLNAKTPRCHHLSKRFYSKKLKKKEKVSLAQLVLVYKEWMMLMILGLRSRNHLQLEI